MLLMNLYVEPGNAVVHCEEMIDPWKAEPFDAFPDTLDQGSVLQLGNFCEIFVCVVHEGKPSDPCHELIGQKCIQIIAVQHTTGTREQIKEEADIEFSIKKCSPSEPHLEAVDAIFPFESAALF